MYRLCPQLLFPLRKSFVEKVMSSLVGKTMTTYAQLALANYISATYAFDLWMPKGARDIFVVMVIFISSD